MNCERTQVLLSIEQLARVKLVARREGRSVGVVIRQAIDAYRTAPPQRRLAAMKRLFALEAPVDDWTVMREQIARGASAER